MKCTFVKPNKERCKANSLRGSDFCFTHDPTNAKNRAIAVSKGGMARKHYQVYGDSLRIRAPKDIQELLSKVINGIWTGKIPANEPGNSIAYLSRCWLDAYETSTIDKRIENLEKKLTTQ